MDNTYTTGQMIDLITKDKELLFEAIGGRYDGGIVEYHDAMQWLMWREDVNTYEPIHINVEFMNTKWKLLCRVLAFQVNVPMMNFGKVCCLVN